MRRAFHLLCSAIALLAIAHAQVMGLHRGYVCELDGVIVETEADHHHDGNGLHSDHFEDYTPHTHDHEEGEQDDTEKHAPLKVVLNAPQTGSAVSAPAMVLHLVFDLPASVADHLDDLRRSAEAVMPPRNEGHGLSPPACLLVAEFAVLLV
jgi:hypothetical protein